MWAMIVTCSRGHRSGDSNQQPHLGRQGMYTTSHIVGKYFLKLNEVKWGHLENLTLHATQRKIFTLCYDQQLLSLFSPPSRPTRLFTKASKNTVMSTVRPAMKFILTTESYFQLFSPLSILNFVTALNRI